MKAKKVRWFHPEGENMPNGVFFQRGGWLAECRENKKRFGKDCGLSVVVFPSGALIEEAGRAFSGRFISESGTRYDGESPTLTLDGLSGRALLKRAVELLVARNQPEALAREPFSQRIWEIRADKKGRFCGITGNRAP